MKRSAITAEFLGAAPNRLFVLARHPAEFSGACVLVCAPFAEEMNKARRMVTLLAQRLLTEGIAVVIPDLFGTGDSDGEFADASWSRWLEDLHTVERWIEGRGWHASALLGIRSGCLLAAQYSQQRGSSARRAVFWQPSVDGARTLDQFLRLRVAASAMRDTKETVANLKERLARGEVVEVAGYGLSSGLAAGLGAARMADVFGGSLEEVHWFEVLRAADAAVPPATLKAQEQLRQRGVEVTSHTLVGEPFWASTEVVCVPELIERTAGIALGSAAHV